MSIDPWIAAALSMILPGLGQLACGRIGRALFWLLGTLVSLGGFLDWVFTESRFSPLEGGVWIVLLAGFELGSWIDAWRLARRLHPVPRRTGKRPELAVALSAFFPGLGQAYLWSPRWTRALFWVPVCALPGLALTGVDALEEPPAPWWPGWLMKWPLGLSVAAGTMLGIAAVVHAWIAGCRRARRPLTLPRLPRAIWVVALAGWLLAELPWTGWLKDRVKSFKIPSSSMEPTLLVGDRIWAKHDPFLERGEIIVFRPPDRPDEDYIKRIVGLPGEKLEVRKKIIWIDDHRLADTVQVHRDPGLQPGRDDFGPVLVPPGCYFVMGDNRDNSRDSRYFGFVPFANVYGRAYKRFWPMARVGPLR